MSLTAYRDRFRRRPLVAVMAHNGFTEITDFLVPFGVLSRSGVAEVVALSSAAGAVRLSTVRVQLSLTLADFDRLHPEGADYIVIPAMMPDDDPVLVDWVREQGRKGGTLVSICLGALVTANSGWLNGRQATSYFVGHEQRTDRFPEVQWQRNVRYVEDGLVISSAGISASVPISLALVEALGGRSKAEQLAAELGVAEWSPRHDSDAFLPKPGEPPVAFVMPQPEDEPIGIPLEPGVDEIALGLTVDAYCHTGKTRPYLLADSLEPVNTRYGLRVIPDRAQPEGRVLDALDHGRSARAIDKALAEISLHYGPDRARQVARIMEYRY